MRTFVGIEFSDEIKAKIAQVQARLISLASKPVRWTAQNNFHLTLVFIGEIDAPTYAAMQPAMNDVARRYAPMLLKIGGFGAFPNWHSPRVLWLGLQEHSGQLLKMQRDLVMALLPFGLKEDARPYHPHITLGYVRPDENAARQVAMALRPVQLSEIAVAQANALTFFESRNGGPANETHYISLARFALCAAINTSSP